MGFLPNDYEPPQSGNYMKLQTGKNRFRVLAPAVVGNMFWRTNGDKREPVRRRMNEKITAAELEVNPKDGTAEKIKHFWAFPVWNYGAKAVQILEITQSTIRDAIVSLVSSDDWGDPTNYDLIVDKAGAGKETEYHVQPAPAKPLHPDATEAFRKAAINMEAIFNGDDPFGGGGAAVAGDDDATANPFDTTINKVDRREVPLKAGGKVNVYGIETDAGRFGTTDDKIGKLAEEIHKHGNGATIAWEATAQGRKIVKLTELQTSSAGVGRQGDHEPLTDEEIPF